MSMFNICLNLFLFLQVRELTFSFNYFSVTFQAVSVFNDHIDFHICSRPTVCSPTGLSSHHSSPLKILPCHFSLLNFYIEPVFLNLPADRTGVAAWRGRVSLLDWGTCARRSAAPAPPSVRTWSALARPSASCAASEARSAWSPRSSSLPSTASCLKFEHK